MSETLLFKIVVLLSAGIFVLPARWKVPYSIPLHIGVGLLSTLWAFQAWASPTPVLIDLGIPFWGGTPAFVIDRLSAFFVLIINVISITGILYGWGYLKPYRNTKSDVAMSVHVWAYFLLHVSMLHVVMMREGFAFLMAWEVMSMSSFLLVIFEGEREDNLKTGIKYLVQMHAGFTFLLLGFLWVSKETGIFGFDGLAPYFAAHTNWILFLVLFLGFAVKAGFMPLHTWLPHAHPAAPSHVSGVMSGVMIKMGIYGILRVLLDVQADFLIIGLVVIILSILTGVGGIIYASMQRDLKKLLAYSSIENIGVIGIGLGTALLGRYFGNDTLSTLALTGALIHVVNHALYKSMLFYTAGSVYHATHTRNMNELGGIIRTMPYTGFFFLVGAISICAIPPFNGFLSEYLIYKSVFQIIGTADFTTSMMILAVILSLVVIGGLSVYTFTKAFGLTFLGSRRGHHSVPEEVSPRMRIAGLITTALIISLTLSSAFLVAMTGEVTALFSKIGFNYEALNGTLPSFLTISKINLLILVVVGIVYWIRRLLQHKEVAKGPTWGCGYSAGDFRHQYTPTSYSKYVEEFAGPFVAIKGKPPSFPEEEVFPARREYKTVTDDLVEEKLIMGPVQRSLDYMASVGWAQTGKIGHYLVYPLAFLIIIMLLTRIGII